MKRHFRWLLFVATLTIPSVYAAEATQPAVQPQPSAQPQPSGRDISGHYSCEGYDAFYDMKYEGPLLIKKVGNDYQFNWNFGEGGGRFSGMALLNPDKKVIAVMFINPDDPNETGVGIYIVNPNGSLSGNWMYQYKDQISNELCTPMNKETT